MHIMCYMLHEIEVEVARNQVGIEVEILYLSGIGVEVDWN